MPNMYTQLACAWSGVVFIVMFGIGFAALAQFVPPPKAHDSAAEIVKMYTEDVDRMRAGLVMMMVSSAFTVPWAAVISVQIKRIEGRFSPLAYTQLALGAAGVLIFIFPVMTMIVATFRPSRDPEIIQTLNDLAWLPFITVFPLLMLQMLSIAAAILSDAREVVFPRWLAYINISCAAALIPAVLIPFAKTGPFAWHGVMEFWLAVIVFFTWFMLMTVFLMKAIRSQSA